MGLFAKFKAGLAKTHSKLVHEIKRIVTRSPKLTADSIEELEAALIAARTRPSRSDLSAASAVPSGLMVMISSSLYAHDQRVSIFIDHHLCRA